MKRTKGGNKIIRISTQEIYKIAENWTNYLKKNPRKLFLRDRHFRTPKSCLELIKSSNGFQITAFAGKAQNRYTHPSRLPDLGEVNLLARLRAIQLLTQKPCRIILDGHYYSKAFHEIPELIERYDRKILKLAKAIGINKEFPDKEVGFDVDGLLKYLNVKKSDLKEYIQYYKKYPKKAYDLVEMYPDELYNPATRMLEEKFMEELEKKDSKKVEETILNICSSFIINKAALSKLITMTRKKDKYQRITILRYAKSKNPRINLEMNFTPWNSTILFKNTYLNVNTAINLSYETLLEDKRNYIILGKNNHFWGFTRNKDLFKDI